MDIPQVSDRSPSLINLRGTVTSSGICLSMRNNTHISVISYLCLPRLSGLGILFLVITEVPEHS